MGLQIHVKASSKSLEKPRIVLASPDHQENMSVQLKSPRTPLLYRENWVCRGIPNFLIFDPKHTLWVLLRTASACTHNVCFELKY